MQVAFSAAVQCADRHFSLGKERNPPALQLKLAARDRNRAAPKAMGGFGTARAVAGVIAASRRQQKATPDGGKSARPRAERSPRSPSSIVVIWCRKHHADDDPFARENEWGRRGWGARPAEDELGPV